MFVFKTSAVRLDQKADAKVSNRLNTKHISRPNHKNLTVKQGAGWIKQAQDK
jgi:hypothetical protein